VTPMLTALVFGTAPASAGPIDVDIVCAGTYLPGDTVPYTATLDEQAGLDHLILVTLTLETPLASKIVFNKNIFLFANQLVSFTKPLKKLGANAPAGTYTATMSVSENGQNHSESCTFDVL